MEDVAIPSDLCSVPAGMQRVRIAEPAEQRAFGRGTQLSW